METSNTPKNQRNNWVITPDKFFDEQERAKLMKHTREQSELDVMKGRQSWAVRWMLVDLALFSGLRVSEIAALKIEDINLKAKDPYLIVHKGKGGKKRVVYLENGLVRHIKQFIQFKKKTLGQSVEPDAFLFPNRSGGQVKPITLQVSFKVAVKKADLSNHYSIHSARHTYATFLYRDTRNLRYVQKQLGHTNIGMTSLYADILPEENGHLANAIKRD